MKKKIPFILIFLIGLCVLLYPFASDIYMSIMQQKAISSYSQQLKNLEDKEIERIKKEAEEYNKKVQQGEVVKGELGEDEKSTEDENADGYYSALSIGAEEIGYLEIPEINVYLPIYHGTTNEILEKGVGHYRGTSLPVGGVSTHTVLTSHSGLPTARLFSDLEKLEEGDEFYVHSLDDVMAYKVDQVKIILPTVTEDLKIFQDKDYVTLLTCYPYGVNTHRLLVRGERIPYVRETDNNGNIGGTADENAFLQFFRDNLLLSILLVCALIVIALFLIFFILYKRKKKKLTTKGSVYVERHLKSKRNQKDKENTEE